MAEEFFEFVKGSGGWVDFCGLEEFGEEVGVWSSTSFVVLFRSFFIVVGGRQEGEWSLEEVV